MKENKRFKKHLAIGVIIVLGVFLFFALRPFYNALFASLILFVLLKPIYTWIITKTKLKSKPIAAILLLLLLTMFIFVPFFFIAQTMVYEINDLTKTAQLSENKFDLITGIEEVIGRNIPVEDIVNDVSANVFTYLSSSVTSIVKSATNFVISLLIMYFALFYLFINSGKFEDTARRIVPFSERHSNQLIEELKKITNTMVLGIGVAALVQGILVSLGFVIFGNFLCNEIRNLISIFLCIFHGIVHVNFIPIPSYSTSQCRMHMFN